jgi:hypothetical protein
MKFLWYLTVYESYGIDGIKLKKRLGNSNVVLLAVGQYSFADAGLVVDH